MNSLVEPANLHSETHRPLVKRRRSYSICQRHSGSAQFENRCFSRMFSASTPMPDWIGVGEARAVSRQTCCGRVLVVDPLGLLSELVRRLDEESDIDVSTEAHLERAVSALAASHPCAVVVAAVLHADSAETVLASLAAGANGRGGRLEHALSPPERVGRDGRLTGREREVLALLASGHTNREIGHALHISERTVETHRAHVTEKLGVRGRAELYRAALRLGLLNRG
jgi:DNA-binding CsgD family transcriptional regulator